MELPLRRRQAASLEPRLLARPPRVLRDSRRSAHRPGAPSPSDRLSRPCDPHPQVPRRARLGPLHRALRHPAGRRRHGSERDEREQGRLCRGGRPCARRTLNRVAVGLLDEPRRGQPRAGPLLGLHRTPGEADRPARDRRHLDVARPGRHRFARGRRPDGGLGPDRAARLVAHLRRAQPADVLALPRAQVPRASPGGRVLDRARARGHGERRRGPRRQAAWRGLPRRPGRTGGGDRFHPRKSPRNAPSGRSGWPLAQQTDPDPLAKRREPLAKRSARFRRTRRPPGRKRACRGSERPV